MAVDFPVATTVGETFDAAGKTYTWNGTGWTADGSGFVPPTQQDIWVYRAGDTMTGALIINGANCTVQSAPASSAFYFLNDENGTSRGHLVWDRTSNSVYMRNGATSTDVAILANGQIYAGRGITVRNGLAGTYGINAYNFFWDVSNLTVFIDDTYLGIVNITSDYRIKKDVVNLPAMWDTVKALRPIKYTQAEFSPPSHAERAAESGQPLFVADDIERWGFIAHELQDTMTPSAATAVKDAPAAIQSPNPMTLLAALTKALQEAMAEIEALKVHVGLATPRKG